MKKLIFISSLVFLSLNASAQFVTLQDTAFRNWIDIHYPGAIVGGALDTTNVLIASEDSIDIFGPEQFFNMDGIKYFDSLKYLKGGRLGITYMAELPQSLEEIRLSSCYVFTHFTNLPPLLHTLYVYTSALNILPDLPSNLKMLTCSQSSLDSLPQLPASLESLSCGQNNLTKLPHLPAGLSVLGCSSNFITQLPSLPPALEGLLCENNILDSLPELPSTLTRLWCSNNLLTSLPVLSDSIEWLLCNNNLLDSLPALPINLNIFECSWNQLTELPILPSSLGSLECIGNQLSSLPSLPQSLGILECFKNQISGLPELPSSLVWLNCRDNLLSCIPLLPNSLSKFWYLSGNNIHCLPNYPVSINLSQADSLIPLCNINDPCPIYANIGGKIYFDSTGNSTYDLGEPIIDFIPVKIQPGNIIAGSSNGNWGYPVDTNVNYTIDANYNLTYFTMVPDSYAVSLNTFQDFDTTLNFGLQALGIFEDLQIGKLGGTQPRPGFLYKVRLYYRNVGTVAQNASVTFTYDTTHLSYYNSTVLPVSQAPGLLNYNLGNLGLFQNGLININFYVDTIAALGDTIHFAATILPDSNDFAPLNNSIECNEIVVGSYDPNDKLVSTDIIFPEQVLNKEWLEYTIRFQNTGTASAINVRLEDSLSVYLDQNSFEYIGASHANQWFLQNGHLVVRFDSIMLPDSSTNQELSNGSFKYRLRVHDNLSPGDSIFNYADIYFDFNSAVRTNTVQTLIICPQLALTKSHSSISCYGASDGMAYITTSGGVPPFIYNWSTGANSSDSLLNNLGPGQYSVYVEDNYGCESVVTAFYLLEPAPLNTFYLPTSTNPSGTSTGSIDLLVQGGVGPYEYLWSSGSTTEDIQNLSPGIYHVTVSDRHGCANLQTVIIN